MTKYYILIGLTIGLAASCQTNSKDEISNNVIGTWKAYKKTTIEGDSLNFLGEKYSSSMHFSLESKGNGTDLNDPVREFKYSQSGDTLLFGNRYYLINAISKQEMVLREFDPSMPDDPLAYLHYLRRKGHEK